MSDVCAFRRRTEVRLWRGLQSARGCRVYLRGEFVITMVIIHLRTPGLVTIKTLKRNDKLSAAQYVNIGHLPNNQTNLQTGKGINLFNLPNK